RPRWGAHLQSAGPADRPYRPAGALRQPLLRRPLSQPAVHGGEPRALCALRQHAGRRRRLTAASPTKESRNMQLWTTSVASPRASARAAKEAEDAGWDGFLVVDSQNLSGDAYVALAMAANATSRIGLGPGVTNSVTRHAAVTACAIASVNRIAQGRAVLGIGRGDSALAHLGRAPARLAQFERYLRQLQAYLGGEAVPFDEIDIPHDVAPPMSGLHLHDAPPDSRIAWMSGGVKVPVEVAASGPKVIAIAAL